MTTEQLYKESELYQEHVVMLDARRDEILRLDKEVERLVSEKLNLKNEHINQLATIRLLVEANKTRADIFELIDSYFK